MKSIVRTRFRFTLAALSVAIVTGCGSDESLPTEDHTAVTYNVLVNDLETTAPYTFAAGQTVRVRLKFFNTAQDDLDDVEAEHFGGLTFDPASRATLTRVTGHNYQFDVTGGTPGGGTLQVSYGHDETADEVTFNPEPVTVAP
jgi:hypothetical protein